MKTTRLIDNATAAGQKVAFDVEFPNSRLYQFGLAGVESVAIEQGINETAVAATDTDWEPIQVGDSAVVLDVGDNSYTFAAPGRFRVVATTSVGAITVALVTPEVEASDRRRGF